MKKFLAVVITVCTLIVSLMCLPANAFTPKGTELDILELPPEEVPMSTGLGSSSVYSEIGFTGGVLSESEMADIAKISYGVSIIGASSLERPITGAADGIWSQGNIGEALANGKMSMGALSWFTVYDESKDADTKYNVRGETDKEDSIYITLLTYNFGEMKNIDSFAIYATSANGYPQAGDVYVSSDGNSWKLVGSYDRCKLRDDNDDYQSIGDAYDTLDGKASFSIGFELNAKGQYVRFAFTCGTGNKDGYDYETYAFVDNETKSIAVREIAVYGSKYEGPAITDAPATASPTASPVITSSPAVTATPKATSSPKATQTTAINITPTPETGKDSNSGIVIVCSVIAAVLVLAVVMFIVLRRKHEKQ